MPTATFIEERIEAVFGKIGETRMRGLPILNPTLSVEAVGFRVWNGEWLGALVTPWSINLMLLPASPAPGLPEPTGTMRSRGFPSGEFEFLCAYEKDIGPYEICSLFSPVTEFEDQPTAVATARAALAFLFNKSLAGLEESSIGAATAPPRGISRRELLRGRLRSGIE